MGRVNFYRVKNKKNILGQCRKKFLFIFEVRLVDKMHLRFLNMESYLIIGLMLFIYSTLVQTTNRDDFIKELTAGIIDGVSEKHDVEDNRLQKDTTTTANSKEQSSTRRNAVEMKKEIIDAFVNLLYDKLQQKTKD